MQPPAWNIVGAAVKTTWEAHGTALHESGEIPDGPSHARKATIRLERTLLEQTCSPTLLIPLKENNSHQPAKIASIIIGKGRRHPVSSNERKEAITNLAHFLTAGNCPIITCSFQRGVEEVSHPSPQLRIVEHAKTSRPQFESRRPLMRENFGRVLFYLLAPPFEERSIDL
jgi:hypothetical protein